MSSDSAKAAAPTEGFFAHLLARWRDRLELSRLPDGELDRVAHELGLSADELTALAAKGPHASDLLYDRMQALGVTRADVDRLGWSLIRDLEKTCSCCGDKGQCKADLTAHPDDPVWKDYCPNAVTLDALRRIKGRGVV